MSIYFDNPWKPAPYSVLQNEEIHQYLTEHGYYLDKLSSTTIIEALSQLFSETHSISDERGGMFYSVYSRNLDYRKKVHSEIGQILKPYLNSLFKNFKVIINSFVVKAPGPESEFYLHQDTTGLDEHKYSALNLWIPLIDVDASNGALALVPKSHQFFSPYRGISFPAPFDNIQSTVRQFLKPIPMQKGEVLIFDNRVLHNSFSNLSEQTRVAVVCGIFPEEAELVTCHKSGYSFGGKVELIQHDPEFILTHPNFLIDCQKRPDTGQSLGFFEDPYPEINTEDFERLCANYQVEKENAVTQGSATNCNLIGEPDHKMINVAVVQPQSGFFSKLKKIFVGK
ncbi:MAG: phytanoyl-CoA dioxygenase family protein [Bacteroidota bacterium]